jgi:putative ATPase
VGYRYPHDHPDSLVPQDYLPEPLVGTVLFRPGSTGAEALLAERLAEIDERMGKKPRE